jgi:uncharacterized protein (DUF1697 family)
MNTYIALLRGINVSGQKLIKMAELKEHLSALQLVNLRTYIQSGNLVFESNESDSKILAHAIESKIKEKYGFDVPTLIRTREELMAIIDHNPFTIVPDDKFSAPYIIFLEDLPNSDTIKSVMNFNATNEIFHFWDRNIYIVYKNGAGTTKLTNTFFESKLKTKATSRNWNTLNKLVIF